MCIRDSVISFAREKGWFSGKDEEFSFADSYAPLRASTLRTVSYTHLRAHETVLDIVCRLLLEKKKIPFRVLSCISAN